MHPYSLAPVTSRLLLEYDGTEFAGWARQPGRRTVQEEVEKALRVVLRDESLAVTVAGRTDAGVHAWGQVCSYEHEAVDPLRLNSLLPRDVAILDCNPVADDFHARRDAVSRTYCYRILNRRTRSVWHAGRTLFWPREIDRDALIACAAALPGRHDFTAFTPAESGHAHFERDVYDAAWRTDGDVLELWITAGSFLRHMNRILVGTMLEVAGGRRTLEDFVALLDGRPRAHAGPTAPAQGLALARVNYRV